MSSFTTEQVTAVRERVVERIKEFDSGLARPSIGVVRLVLDVFAEWQGEQGGAEFSRTRLLLERASKVERAPVPVPDDDRPDPPPATSLEAMRQLADRLPDNGNGFYVGADGTEQTPWESPVAFPPGPFGDYPPGDDPAHQATPVSQVAPADATENPADVLPPTSDKKSPAQTATSDKKSLPPAPAVPRQHTHEVKPDVTAINKPRTLAEANRSESRQRQLDSLKTQRRLEADRKDREARARAAADVTYEQLLREIKRISMGGHMPTQTAFNMSKPATWPTASALMMKFHTTWELLAEACDLEWSRGRKNVPSAA